MNKRLLGICLPSPTFSERTFEAEPRSPPLAAAARSDGSLGFRAAAKKRAAAPSSSTTPAPDRHPKPRARIAWGAWGISGIPQIHSRARVRGRTSSRSRARRRRAGARLRRPVGSTLPPYNPFHKVRV